MTCDFRSFSTVLQSYKDNVRVVVIGCVQWNPRDIKILQLRRFLPPGQGYKTFFMLSSVEHEILNAHKYKNIKKFGVL